MDGQELLVSMCRDLPWGLGWCWQPLQPIPKKPRGLQQGSLAFGVRVPHFGDDAGWRRQGLMKFRLSEAVQGSVTITSLAGGLLLSLHTQLPAGRGMQGEPDQAKLSI